jgi:YD repeat-containing protein
MGRDRSLTLVYNSAAAEPRPRVAVLATLPGGTQPQTVYTELTLSGGTRASATFSSWAPGTARQLVLAFDATGFATGLYPFTLLVRSNFPGAVYDAIVNDTVIIVNREASEFGAGWYPSGVEQLFLSQPGGSVLWVGGDGSAKIYRSIGGGQWQAPPGAFRDVIVQVSTTYERRTKHGVTVTFDAMGRHIRTRNRLGHITTFTWDGNGKLIQVKVPGPGGD